MSWTSYVEKSGSGMGVIIDKCTEHGLARPEFDPTSGFFKTIIWRTGSAAAKGLVKGPSRDPVAGPSHGAESWPSQGAQSRGPVRGRSQGAQSNFIEAAMKYIDSRKVGRASTRPPRRFHRNRPTGQMNLFYCRSNKIAIPDFAKGQMGLSPAHVIVTNANAIRQFGPFPFGSLDRNFSA